MLKTLLKKYYSKNQLEFQKTLLEVKTKIDSKILENMIFHYRLDHDLSNKKSKNLKNNKI